MRQMHRLRIILVRHGESENNIYHEISLKCFKENRVADPDITDLGRRQAESVANHLKERSNAILADLDEIHVSPMRRTLQTAAIIARELPTVPVRVWTDIYEVSGMYDRGVGQPGMTRSQLRAEFPTFRLPASVTEKGWYPVELGMEKVQHGIERCQRVWERLVRMANELEQDKSIVMIVHGAFISNLLKVAFGLIPPQSSKRRKKREIVWAFPMWNGAITALDIHNSGSTNRSSLLFHNAVGHLSPELVKTDKLGKC